MDRVPKFVKKYANIQEIISHALASYVADVKLRQFPEATHMFTMKEEEWIALYGGKRS